MKATFDLLVGVFERSRTWLLVILGMCLTYRLLSSGKMTAEGVVAIVGAIGTYVWRATKRDQNQTTTSEGKE